MLRRSLILLLLLVFAVPCSAQQGTFQIAQDISTTTCNGTTGAGCVAADVSGDGHVTVQLLGTWVGTVTFDCSMDGINFQTINMTPTNSATAVTTASANGIWQGQLWGVKVFRVRFSAYTSGTATVWFGTAPQA
jgi:hypothetical protein